MTGTPRRPEETWRAGAQRGKGAGELVPAHGALPTSRAWAGSCLCCFHSSGQGGRVATRAAAPSRQEATVSQDGEQRARPNSFKILAPKTLLRSKNTGQASPEASVAAGCTPARATCSPGQRPGHSCGHLGHPLPGRPWSATQQHLGVGQKAVTLKGPRDNGRGTLGWPGARQTVSVTLRGALTFQGGGPETRPASFQKAQQNQP